MQIERRCIWCDNPLTHEGECNYCGNAQPDPKGGRCVGVQWDGDGGALVLCQCGNLEVAAWACGSWVGMDPAHRHRETYTQADALAVAEMVNASSWITRVR